jgi:hypothetical protein
MMIQIAYSFFKKIGCVFNLTFKDFYIKLFMKSIV